MEFNHKSISFVLYFSVTIIVVRSEFTIWTDHDSYGRNLREYPIKEYSIAENPNAKYNPNLPEELRAKYVGQSWSQKVHEDVCSRSPDSGYYCMGAVGDIPPLEIRFYFDVRANSCRCFIYNGCDGNQNNFRNVDHCLEWCSPNTTIADRLNKDNVYVIVAQESECLYFY